MHILRIAVFSPLRRLFDYLGKDTPSLQPGVRIKVPFGTKERIGILIETTSESSLPFDKLKPIISVLDETPLFPETVFKLIIWAARYYHCPIGEVFEAAIPSSLRKGKDLLSEEDLKNKEDVTKPIQIHASSFKLNAEQLSNAQMLIQALGKFEPFLLEGVTGSGKTEVYFEVIEAALQQKKQALLLVPEHGLIPQMLKRLQTRFSVPISIIHSKLTEKQRLIAWQNAKSGNAGIILGSRSAAFTPLAHPGVFIIDEEHDLSFKQQDSFRYSARDLLLKRGSLENCPVVLGSATPCLETLYNVEKKGFKKICLHKRSLDQPLPTISTIDIRHKKLDQGLSYLLIKKMKEHLENDGQVLLFLNRRGFAPVYMCYDCGNIFQCKHCDAYLTLHYKQNELRCHHCDFKTTLSTRCKECGSDNLNAVGVGTERLEAALTTHFPDYPVLRIDKDTTRKKGALQSAVDRIHSGEARILLGTQMITKGHHFPNVSLVAILDIDAALFSVDFRSQERLGQLITQVAGRAGRETRLGEVLLQTCHPNHPLLQLLLQKGYSSFAEQLLTERKITKLPPYCHAALIHAQAKKEFQVFNFLGKLKEKAIKFQKSADFQNIQILGPVASPLERKQGKYRAQLLLNALDRPSLHAALKHLIDLIETQNLAKGGLSWTLDIDPQET